MLIVKLNNKTIDQALKIYKSKVIQTRQISKLNERKEYLKKSVKRRKEIQKAIYSEKKSKENL